MRSNMAKVAHVHGWSGWLLSRQNSTNRREGRR